jgi:small GTP-binding protein
MSGKDEVRVKMLIIGESYVGKSSLLTQYVDEEFSMNHTTTIGVEYKQKILKLEDGNSIRVQIWDTAGTTRYNTITPNYYRNVDGILLVFDISNQKSFEMVNFWIKEVNEKTDVSKIDLLLVGNKNDLEDKREVDKGQAAKVAEQIGIVYV